jgi:hypothetical protein
MSNGLDFAGLGAKLLEILPAATGAMISLRFLPPDTLSKGQRLTSAIAAYAIGTYAGRGITAYFNITNERVIDGIVFGVALFGMAFVGTAMSEIRPILQALRKKYIGDVPKEEK